MSVNKKIIAFCVVSLIAVCVFLADRGGIPEDDSQAVSVTQESYGKNLPRSAAPATGGAVITSASGAAVRGSDEGDAGGERADAAVSPGGKGKGRDEEKSEKGDQADDQANEADGDAVSGHPKHSSGKTKEKGDSDLPESGQSASVKSSTEKTSSGKKTSTGKKASVGKKSPTGKTASGTASRSSDTGNAQMNQASVNGAAVADSGAMGTTQPPTVAPTPKVEKTECLFTVTCSEILFHMDKLKESIKKVIPADGIIAQETVAFREGDTVFDALGKLCADRGIPLDYTFTPGFGTYYIKGINHLYEFDCGDESGWMYSVNGKNPDCGCSQYKLERGDQVVFYYTCER